MQSLRSKPETQVVICDISPKIADAEAALKAKHPGAQVLYMCSL